MKASCSDATLSDNELIFSKELVGLVILLTGTSEEALLY